MLLYYTGLSLSWQYIEFQSRLRHKVFSMIYCYLNTVKIPISVWGKPQKLNMHPNPVRKHLFENCGVIWKYLLVIGKFFGVTWCCLVSLKSFFFKKKSDAKVAGLLHRPAYKKLNKRLFLLRAPVKKLEYLISRRGGYSVGYTTEIKR